MTTKRCMVCGWTGSEYAVVAVFGESVCSRCHEWVLRIWGMTNVGRVRKTLR